MRSNRYYLVVVVATVVLIFYSQQLASPFLGRIPDSLSLLVHVVYSVGAYTFIAKTLAYGLTKIRLLRQWFLGTAYLEGTWVGLVQKPDGPKLVIEHVEQDMHRIVGCGSSYNGPSAVSSNWDWEHVDFDAYSRTLKYSYGCSTKDKGAEYKGLARFTASRKHGSAISDGLRGFLYDFDDSKVGGLSVEEIKFSSKCVPHDELIPFCIACKDIAALRAAKDEWLRGAKQH